MDFPLVSIIIVNYNGKNYLEKCLESLSKVKYSNLEIIIVDNNSTDGSIEFVENNYSEVIIKKLEKNYGFAYPNNLGSKIAKGEFLLFLNNDTKVDPNFLNPLIESMMSNSKIAICQSLLLRPDGKVDSSGDFMDIYGRAYSSKTIPKEQQHILSARGASMLVRKEIFYELDMFDEKFFVSFEDVDLGWRAWINDFEVIIVPNSIVYHYGGGTISKMREDIQFHGTKNSLILRLTNFEFFYAIRSIFGLFFVVLSRRTLGYSIIADPEVAPPLPKLKTMLSAVKWVFQNFSYVRSKRKQIQKNRKLKTSDLIKKELISKIK